MALEVLNVLERDKMLAHVKEVGNYFIELLGLLDARHGAVVDVRGVGLMVGMELDSAELAKFVQKAMLEKKIIINRTHETVLRFLPPYVVTKKQVEEVVKALDESCPPARHLATPRPLRPVAIARGSPRQKRAERDEAPGEISGDACRGGHGDGDTSRRKRKIG